MRIIITADWHFGYPGKLNDLVWAFNRMLKYCIDNKIDKIAILGDLTHDREHLNHDVSNTLFDLLNQAKLNGIDIITLIGNHDMYYRHKWKINALKPFKDLLIYIDNVSTFELSGKKFWVVPFIEHEPSYIKVINSINKMASPEDILLTHVGISSANMNSCFLIQNWNAISFENTIFNRIYAGHFHCMQQVGSKSWIPGSPIPFRFDEGLIEHGFFDYDINKNEHKFINMFELNNNNDIDKKPPDFITVSSEDVDKIIDCCENDNVRVKLTDIDNKDEIVEKLKKAGALKVIVTKPKQEQITKNNDFIRSKDVFESWLDYDNPEGLNKKLLIEINRQIKADTRIEDD